MSTNTAPWKARHKATGTVVEAETHEGRTYYLGTAVKRTGGSLVHKVDARTRRTHCGFPEGGVWDADVTEDAREGKPLRSLVTCKGCGGSRSNAHPELGG